MKNNNGLIIAGMVGLGLYMWSKNKENTPLSSDGSFNEAVPPTSAPIYGTMTTSSPNGKLSSVKIENTAQGVNAINTALSTGQSIISSQYTIIPTNTTFKDNEGNTYRTGSNQTVAKLATSDKPVVLTVNTVKQGTSFFNKPIKNINGKNTRVY